MSGGRPVLKGADRTAMALRVAKGYNAGTKPIHIARLLGLSGYVTIALLAEIRKGVHGVIDPKEQS